MHPPTPPPPKKNRIPEFANCKFPIQPRDKRRGLAAARTLSQTIAENLAERQICHHDACREADLSPRRLPRGRFVTTTLAERQICHYDACREADLSPRRLPRGRFVTTTLPLGKRRSDKSGRLPRGRFVTTTLAERQICHHDAASRQAS